MADAAVTFLLEHVTQLMKSYVDLIYGAENELEQLKKELSLLKAFLQEAAEKPKKEETFREWERQIREVVYDAEDTIDTCLTEAAVAKGKRSIFKGGRSSKRVSLAKEIKSLREEKVKPLFDMAKMHFVNTGEGSGKKVEENRSKVTKVQSIRKDNVVGFEDEEETIINYLKEKREELDVISIIGMPGLGKTTLAWKIYQNQKIQYEFPTRIWVYVSQDFNTRDVFLSILKGFTNQDLSTLSDQDLTVTLRAYMEKGKFLLVMDDVWTIEAWNYIKNILPKNNRSSKVLITSREWSVGKHANVTRDPHKLRFLDEKESWELVQLEVFGKLDDCPEELEQTGKYIAKQCHGLPLALVVIGGILLEQYSPKQPVHTVLTSWKKVSENVNTHVRNDKVYRTSDIVALSYKNLPSDLRDCFIYLGVFPEDYEIPVWRLTCLWIAEGFVQHKEGQSLEETAEENLKDLINRNLVMLDKTKPNGEIKTCRVHDVIREFCKSKAAIKEHNLFQEIKKSTGNGFEPPVSNIQNYRRLCIHFHLPVFLSEFLTGKLKGPRIRSFLCFCRDPLLLDPKYLSTIPDTFNLLRVLESKSIKFNQFPPKVTKLIHLRYVTLSCDNLSILPETVAQLWNLQTLVVDTKSGTLQMKASLWKMIQLRQLKTKAAIVLVDQEEGEGGENLQTVSRLSPKNCTQDVFKKARNLKQLGIRGDLENLLECGGTSFGKLDCLETLKLKHELSYETASENPLSALPLPNHFPPNIKKLTLSATSLDWKHMSTLAKIDTLEVLKLKDKAFMGKQWNVVAKFLCLQFLLIDDTDLFSWEASNVHFPSLWCLVLKNCEKLSKIPMGLAKSLQMLNIERVPKTAVESAEKIKEEKERILGLQQARRGGFKLDIGPGCK